MKNLKWCFVLAIGFLSTQLAQAQPSIKEKEKETIIASKEQKTKIIEHKGVTYYVMNGLWHTKLKNKFILRAAPKGAIIDQLPPGGKKIKLTGKTYYKCRGVFYMKRKSGKGFVVARP